MADLKAYLLDSKLAVWTLMVYLLEMRTAILMELSLEPWLANYSGDLTGPTKDNSMGLLTAVMMEI